MKKTLPLLGAIIFLVFAVSPILAQNQGSASEAIPAAKVVRIEDEFHFMIHGKPYGRAPPLLAEAEYTYKNLSPNPQDVTIYFRWTWNYEREITENYIVNPGEEITYHVAGDRGTIVEFELYVNGELKIPLSAITMP